MSAVQGWLGVCVVCVHIPTYIRVTRGVKAQSVTFTPKDAIFYRRVTREKENPHGLRKWVTVFPVNMVIADLNSPG